MALVSEDRRSWRRFAPSRSKTNGRQAWNGLPSAQRTLVKLQRPNEALQRSRARRKVASEARHSARNETLLVRLPAFVSFNELLGGLCAAQRLADSERRAAVQPGLLDGDRAAVSFARSDVR